MAHRYHLAAAQGESTELGFEGIPLCVVEPVRARVWQPMKLLPELKGNRGCMRDFVETIHRHGLPVCTDSVGRLSSSSAGIVHGGCNCVCIVFVHTVFKKSELELGMRYCIFIPKNHG